MEYRNTLGLAAEDPYTVTVEPWADEFVIHRGQDCSIVAIHHTAPPTFTVRTHRDSDLVVYVNEGGATYEFWRDGQLEFSTPVPIPTQEF